jgi:hypothetical protein
MFAFTDAELLPSNSSPRTRFQTTARRLVGVPSTGALAVLRELRQQRNRRPSLNDSATVGACARGFANWPIKEQALANIMTDIRAVRKRTIDFIRQDWLA